MFSGTMNKKTAEDLAYILGTVAIAHKDIIAMRAANPGVRTLGIADIHLKQAIQAMQMILQPIEGVYTESEFVLALDPGETPSGETDA